MTRQVEYKFVIKKIGQVSTFSFTYIIFCLYLYTIAMVSSNYIIFYTVYFTIVLLLKYIIIKQKVEGFCGSWPQRNKNKFLIWKVTTTTTPEVIFKPKYTKLPSTMYNINYVVLLYWPVGNVAI